MKQWSIPLVAGIEFGKSKSSKPYCVTKSCRILREFEVDPIFWPEEARTELG